VYAEISGRCLAGTMDPGKIARSSFAIAIPLYTTRKTVKTRDHALLLADQKKI
jgi:hypothetical protein